MYACVHMYTCMFVYVYKCLFACSRVLTLFFYFGALQMLINFPKTDINLKSDGGITPLMDTVKTTNIYMVKQLVKKNADISIADYEGRYEHNYNVTLLYIGI